MPATEREEISKMLPIRMKSVVVRGFGRGSSDLGIPTANMGLTKTQGGQCWSVPLQQAPTLESLPTGIYWGFARIGSDSANHVAPVYSAAISMGYNPTYGNDTKTVEPHLIAPESDPRRHASSCGETVLQEFYDQPIRLSVCGYLRPELPFEGLEKLTLAIKKDISETVELAGAETELNAQEHAWVAASGDDMQSTTTDKTSSK